MGWTNIPKETLVSYISQSFASSEILNTLGYQRNRNVDSVLVNLRKQELIDLLLVLPDGEGLLEKGLQDFPLRTNPTLYMLVIEHFPSFEEIIENSKIYSEAPLVYGFTQDNNSLVPIVYSIQSAKAIEDGKTIEIPIVYDRQVEYRHNDINDPSYGEVDYLYSLETGFIWYTKSMHHAVIACSDSAAFKPIMNYGTIKHYIQWYSPLLSEELLRKLAEGAIPRTASFSKKEINLQVSSPLDVQSFSLSDPQLAESSSFHLFLDDSNRTQTHGYYSKHPDIIDGGLSIATRNGKLWTPRVRIP